MSYDLPQPENPSDRLTWRDDTTHTALQTLRFYSQEIDGVPLNGWTADFLENSPLGFDRVEEP